MPVFPNPPTDFSVLIQPTNTATVLQVIINSLVTMGIRADLWPKEGVAVSCMTAVAAIYASFINGTVIPAIRMGLLPTSFGNWLAWLALYMYGVVKVQATFATGQVTLTNNGGGNFNFQPFTVVFQNQTTKATYTNTQAIALPPGPGTTQTVSIQATVQGASSNAVPGDVAIIVTTMLNVTCTNTAAVVGLDAQSDEFVRLACWNAIAANSAYGPRTSFLYAAQTAINAVTLAPVNINRIQLSTSTPAGLSTAAHTGQVNLYLAAPGGVPDPNDVIGVANNLEGIARPEGVQIATFAAATLPDTDTLTCYVAKSPGLNASTIQTAIQAALVSFFASPSSNPIGGKTRTKDNFTGISGEAVAAVCNSAWPPRPTDPSQPWVSTVYAVQGANDYPLVTGQVLTNSTTVVVVLV